MRFLAPDEITQLANAIHPRYRALVLTAAYSGARIGESAALDLDHYEPLRRTIRIERTLSEVNGYIRVTEPKTRAAIRAITLPTWLAETLAEHLANWPVSDSRILSLLPKAATCDAHSGAGSGSLPWQSPRVNR